MDLSFWVIEKVEPSTRGGDFDRKLLQVEARWIYHLNSLNESLEFQCFY